MISKFFILIFLLSFIEIVGQFVTERVFLTPLTEKNPPFWNIYVPVFVQKRQGGSTCVHSGNKHPDGEEWPHYTTNIKKDPYYGFKLKCTNGKVTVLGCYESEQVVPVGGNLKSKFYKGFDMHCSEKGFKYKHSQKTCRGHPIGKVWKQGFYKYECTDKGLRILACLDLQGKEREVGEEYTVLKTYKMICKQTKHGLVVEAIACIDEHGQEVDIGKTVRSPWYIRTCQERRNTKGRQTEVALNITHCCEATSEHCIKTGEREPSVVFKDLTFLCIKRGNTFTYRYIGADGKTVEVDLAWFSTTIFGFGGGGSTATAKIYDSSNTVTAVMTDTNRTIMTTTNNTELNQIITDSNSNDTQITTTTTNTPELNETVTDSNSNETQITTTTTNTPELNETTTESNSNVTQITINTGPWTTSETTNNTDSMDGTTIDNSNNTTDKQPTTTTPAITDTTMENDTDSTSTVISSTSGNVSEQSMSSTWLTSPTPDLPTTSTSKEPDISSIQPTPTKPTVVVTVTVTETVTPMPNGQSTMANDQSSPKQRQTTPNLIVPSSTQSTGVRTMTLTVTVTPTTTSMNNEQTTNDQTQATVPMATAVQPTPAIVTVTVTATPSQNEVTEAIPSPAVQTQAMVTPEDVTSPQPSPVIPEPDVVTVTVTVTPEIMSRTSPSMAVPTSDTVMDTTINKPTPVNPPTPATVTVTVTPETLPQVDPSMEVATAETIGDSTISRPSPVNPPTPATVTVTVTPEQTKPIPSPVAKPTPATVTVTVTKWFPGMSTPMIPSPTTTKPDTVYVTVTITPLIVLNTIASVSHPTIGSTSRYPDFFFDTTTPLATRATPTARVTPRTVTVTVGPWMNTESPEIVEQVTQTTKPDIVTVTVTAMRPTTPMMVPETLRPTKPLPPQTVTVTVTNGIDTTDENLLPHLPTKPSRPDRATVFVTVTPATNLNTDPDTGKESLMGNKDEICSANEKCPASWVQMSNHCYYFAKFRQRRNVEKAENVCRASGGYLMILNSMYEWKFLKNHLEKIGSGYPGKGYDGFWVGFRYNELKKQWEWDTKSDFKEIPWLPIKSRNKRDVESSLRRCGDIKWYKTQWGMDNDNCNHREWFICESCITKTTTTTEEKLTEELEKWNPDDVINKCRVGWIEYNKHCYFFSKPESRLDYDSAAQLCSNHGAHLVVVNDQNEWLFLGSEAEILKGSLPDEGFDGYYIGLERQIEENTWSWIRDSNFNELQWFPEDLRRSSQLTKHGKELTCGEIRNDIGRWGLDKEHCLHLQGYICEKSLGNAPGDCQMWKYHCGSHSKCTENDKNEWKCKCLPGFQGDGKTCVDINECLQPMKRSSGRQTDTICGPNAICKNTQGSYFCICKANYKERNGKCVESGTCFTYGDPHYMSFDGAKLHYQGTCRNILVQVKQSAKHTMFRIDTMAEVRDNFTEYSWTRDIYLTVYGREIGLLKSGVVTVDGVTVSLPYSVTGNDGAITIQRTARGHVQATSSFGLVVVFDGENRAEIQLSADYKGMVSGICGNFNDDKTDDWKSPQGKQMPDPNKFGNSWLSPDDKKKPIKCLAHHHVDPNCLPGKPEYVRAERFCRPLKSNTGPFEECYTNLGMDAEGFFQSCIIDVCGTGPDSMCFEFENVAAMCAEKNLPIRGWRALLGCPPKTCGKHQQYLQCGPACPKTCVDVLGIKQPVCTQRCQEGCFCELGYVLNDNTCVKPEHCGCQYNSRYVRPDETYFKDDACKILCKCVFGQNDKGARSECTFSSCDYNAICAKPGGVPQCICREGFTGNGLKCHDVDECTLGQASCSGDQVCSNTVGSYSCSCRPGFLLSLVTPDACEDINECQLLTNPCGDPLAECHNLPGSYNCACPRGYMMKTIEARQSLQGTLKVKCLDIDECLLKLHNCDATKSFCKNVPGSYKCQCLPGFVDAHGDCRKSDVCQPNLPAGENGCHEKAKCVDSFGQKKCICLIGYEGDGINNCQDIDECVAFDGKCGSNGVCQNTIGSLSCDCINGFEKSDNGQCRDKDECSGKSVCGSNSKCTNTYGSYVCDCVVGYELESGKCKEVDECVSKWNKCDKNAQCTNTIGSYNCRCSDGFKGNGFFCSAFDPCSDLCNSRECDQHATCFKDISASRGFRCVCNNGFEGNGFICQDVNECAIGVRCSSGSQCINTIGSYICKCADGFQNEVGVCIQSRSCSHSTASPCDRNAHCVHAISGVACSCRRGFTGSGMPGDCSDVDECALGDEALCGPNAVCRNIPGSYRCECTPGFHLSPCQDINECLDSNSNKCGPNSKCLNTFGSYSCLCQSGYKNNDPTVCARTDRCVSLRDQCHSNAYCTDALNGPLCKCKEGYTGDGFNCQDIDECNLFVNSNFCPIGSKCVNTIGSYSCQCSAGFESTASHHCQDVDECLNKCRSVNETCVNTYGSYLCLCKEGFRWNQMLKLCLDIDECSVLCYGETVCDDQRHPLCPFGSSCINTIGGYFCQCDGGKILETGKSCSEINECQLGIDNCNGDHMICIDDIDGFHCGCEKGFQSIVGPDGPVCRDRNECLVQNNTCSPYAQCVNLIGSYKCHCKAGFAGNGLECSNIDECAISSKCHKNAQCTNTFGSYECKCNDGYTGDGITHCQLLDDCGRRGNLCPVNSDCILNTDGKHTCQCKLGYTGQISKGCLDIDECNEGIHDCNSSISFCQNFPGSFRCNCLSGYQLDRVSGQCRDINECFNKHYHCSSVRGRCLNTPGSYKCGCIRGYDEFDPVNGTDSVCTDVDECSYRSCPGNSTCLNVPGSFYCDCPSGFRHDPADVERCVDINECLEGLHNCQPSVQCKNTIGSYRCKCPTGYRWNRTGCADVNECSHVVGHCSSDARCVNFPGSFGCLCPDGYSGDGKFSCQDNDECLDGTSLCHRFSSCINTAGSYLCRCNQGFTGDGKMCYDLDECSTDDDLCNGTAKCINTFGSYSCYCGDGYKFALSANGQLACQDIDECAEFSVHCNPHQICHNTVGSFECICQPGFLPINSKHNGCTDINECLTKSDGCGSTAVCVNTIGTYTCICPAGYTGDGKLCRDVDECLIMPAICGSTGHCINTPGSYYCDCKSPLVWNSFTNACISDTDLCSFPEFNPCYPTLSRCSFTNNVVSCECMRGYEGDGKNCKDINECGLGLDTCPVGSICKNTPGSFSCQCISGNEMVDGICQDINECLVTGSCHQNATCTNLQGTFSCKCIDCFIGDGFVCVPDQCCRCHQNASCIDDSCFCKAGFIGDGLQCRAACVNHKCNPQAECVADPTDDLGYVCRCKVGMTGDGFKCREKVVDTCQRLQIDCGNGTCLSGAVGNSDYSCLCRDGYEFRDGTCLDYNECVDNWKILCGSKGRCVNLFGSFRCNCPSGQVFHDGSKRCKDGHILTKPPDCSQGLKECRRLNAFCVDLSPYGFECKCKSGHKKNQDGVCLSPAINRTLLRRRRKRRSVVTCGKGFTYSDYTRLCEDKNECQKANDCPKHSFCLNLKGGFQCRCESGFLISPLTDLCVDVDECQNDHSICGSGTICINNIGSYTCVCLPGYDRDSSTTCVIVASIERCNEMCGLHGHCVSSVPVLRCVCDPGYTLNRTGIPIDMPVLIANCTDKNECELGIDDCHSLADCTNTLGSHTCACKAPFIGDGRHCDLADICTRLSPCHPNASCVAHDTSFQCQCNEGFMGDGKFQCVANRCLHDNGGCPLTSSCIPDLAIDSYFCLCYPGYFGSYCDDIDECAANNVCAENAQCTNMPGSFVCSCNYGYTGDAKTDCYDINECAHAETHGCHVDAECYNTDGSYVCTCKEGFIGNGLFCELDHSCLHQNCRNDSICSLTVNATYGCLCNEGYQLSDGYCADTDECSQVLELCSDTEMCYNTIGSYVCECKSGFERKNGFCVDINECELELANCTDNRTCRNTIGSYNCECIPGYSNFDSECVDIDECHETTILCDTNAVCENTDSSFICRCLNGFTGNGFFCTDMNECAQNVCTDLNEKCVNTEGSFECVCPHGFINTGTGCWDMDECMDNARNNCNLHAICINTQGSYKCTCNQGYIGNGINCSEADPCLFLKCAENAICVVKNNHPICKCEIGFAGDGTRSCQVIDYCQSLHNCSDKAQCIALEAGYLCKCIDGYVGNGLECYDLNECNTSIADCDPGRTKCVNTEGSYHCDCLDGFQYTADHSSCFDVNECIEVLHNCQTNQNCINTQGSYQCVCKESMYPRQSGTGCTNQYQCSGDDSCMTNARCVKLNSESSDCVCDDGFRKSGFTCSDIDECAEDLSFCHSFAFCQNTIGSFVCHCLRGFEGDGISCQDADECLNSNVCHDHALCLNFAGGYSCSCRFGYHGNGRDCQPLVNVTLSIGPSGFPLSECDVEHNLCGDNAKCLQVSNGYMTTRNCFCDVGYFGQPNTGCQDIDECTMYENVCPLTTQCVNTEGSFICVCSEGFEQTGPHGLCIDINECQTNINVCSSLSHCTNTYGSYICNCLSGYRSNQNDSQCYDVDECSSGFSSCHRLASCVNVPGSYHCYCLPGYTGNGRTYCTELDLCKSGPGCDPNALCMAANDSYICSCQQGFQMKAHLCFDIDECHLGMNVCDAGANCINTIGSYYCKCKEGFTGDQFSCTDVNECSYEGVCAVGSFCQNTFGSYQCICMEGFENSEDGRCLDVNECLVEHLFCGEHECINTRGSYYCNCKPGFYWDIASRSCYDFDECQQLNPCQQWSFCFNTFGSYYCQCFSGYEEINGTCVDVDECDSAFPPCTSNEVCANMPGSFQCLCRSGYYNEDDVCIDVDECMEPIGSSWRHNCSVNAQCYNTDGGFICRCNSGFSGSGVFCSDINECKLTKSVCDEMSDCYNTRGGYLCKCKPGYEMLASGNCVDLDECSLNWNVCSKFGSSRCVNTQGSFICICLNGYLMVDNNTACKDIDECTKLKPCDTDTEYCRNTFGSFVCQCKAGYVRNGNQCLDYDECVDNPCHSVGSFCHNTLGSFQCYCTSGYRKIGSHCHEICRDYSCPVGRVCHIDDENNTAKCICDLSASIAGHINRPLCTTRFQHFFTLADMAVDSCSRNITHVIDYYGDCLSSCEMSNDIKIQCLDGKACVKSNLTGLPTCI